jgi:hypothetical protein
MQQTISWTAIPNGTVRGREDKPHLRLSVVVSPRLEPDLAEVPLSAFAPFGTTSFASWPPLGLAFDVTFASPGGVSHVFSRVTPLAPVGDATLWHQLFPPTRPVRPFGFRDLTLRPIR